MSKQPEALRLADALLNDGAGCTCYAHSYSECVCDANWGEQHIDAAVAELRRLHEGNAEVVEALEYIIKGVPDTWWGVKNARAGIAKATGEQQ